MSPRGKKLLLFAAALSGVLAAVVACILLLQEPSFKGKPISYWLDQLLGNRAEPIAPKLAALAQHKNPVVRAYALRALQATSQTAPETLK